MSWRPYVDSGNLSSTEIIALLYSVFSQLLESNENIELQLKLLNARVEEAFETGIGENDVH